MTKFLWYNLYLSADLKALSAGDANVAQLAERLIRNEQVNGSIPFIGSNYRSSQE